MLSSGWPNTSIEKQRESFKGPCVNKTSVHLKSEKWTLMPKQGKRVRSKKMKRKKTNTVFMVNLPLSKGEILLKRSSFSANSLLESSASTSADLDPISESRIFACEFECETASFTDNHLKDGSEFQTSQPQQEIYQGDVDAREYAPEGHVTLTGFENVDDYASDAVCFNQCQDITGTEDWTAYGEWRCNGRYGSQESSSNEFHGNWNNEDLQTKSIGMFPALLDTKNWTFDNSYYRQEEGGTEQFDRSASAIKYGTGMEGSRQRRDMGVGSGPVQYHYQQPLLNPQTGSMWGYHGMSAEVASYLDAVRKFMQTPSKDSLVCSGSISQELRGQCHDTDLQQLQTCSTVINHSEMWPSDQTQFTSYPVSHVDHRLMPYPNHNTVLGTNPE